MENNFKEPQPLRTSIRTFTHDYYLMQFPQKQKFPFYKDHIDFRGQSIDHAAIARIYGTNEYGQKCCCHIHGYFPSFYIKLQQYSQYINQPSNKIQFLTLIQTLFQQVYKTTNPIIYQGYLQQRYDFYGYHSKKQPFLKILLYNPNDTLKMRQLMGSKMVGNKFFQCYEAHLNYFMQMFTDLNILGIHEMNVCGFSFRRNLPLMRMLAKIDPKLECGVMREGWDVEGLYLTNPQYFNNLHKQSSCYVEIDFWFENIMNQFQEDNDYWSDCENSFDSEIQLGENDMVQMNVKVTTALNQIWKDEMKRRQNFGIKQKPFSYIDYSNNIQSQIRKNKTPKHNDPLWISFLHKGTNFQDTKKMIKSFTQHSPPEQKKELDMTNFQFDTFNDQLQRQKEELVSKVKSRWDFYETRKNNIISEIVRGERDELPQWEDDYGDEKDEDEDVELQDEQIEEEHQSQSQATSKPTQQNLSRPKPQQQTLLSFAQKPKPQPQKPLNPFQIMMRKQTNTVKYRNNFNPKEFKFKEGGIFAKCLKCRNTWEYCWCHYKEEGFVHLEISDKEKESCQIKVYQYEVKPPGFDQVKNEKLPPIYQRPYFNDFSDLLLQFNRNQLTPDLKIAQNIDRHAVYPKDSDRRPVTIRNDLKLPYFYLTFQTPAKDNSIIKDYVFKYDQKPPCFQEVQNQVCPPKKKLQKGQSRFSLAKFQDTFVSDLILLKYELLVQVSDPTKFYGNPQTDKIRAIFFQLSNYQNYYKTLKCMIYEESVFDSKEDINVEDFDEVFCVKNELGILQLLINLIIRVDVDLLIAYDQEKRGIYYLLMRSIQYGIDLCDVLSRSGSLQDALQFINFRQFTTVKETYLKRQFLCHGMLEQQQDINTYKKNSQATTAYLNLIKQKTIQRKNRAPQLRKKYSFNINLRGRVNINLHRICEQQLKLKSYTLENVAKHMFKAQFCQFTDSYLNSLLVQGGEGFKGKRFVQMYFLDKLELEHLVIHELNVIGGILEKSKIYGADFVSMMERGSQFKIEAVMCRVTKKRNYLTLSATRNQVANQSILECRPLVIEPPKQFFEEPVLLFDFQSLYPSVMIAYNICYSTCLGSLKELFKEGRYKKIGVSDKLSIDLEYISKMLQTAEPDKLNQFISETVFVTPNRVAFVKKGIKEGLIPQILLQFLMTRIMIKKSSKFYKKQSIKHLLKQRQTALKLFMNVLYGYTGASFTGRMPCSQIADSVVEISKYCLKQSIDYLNNHEKFKGRVIYGDTDSIFFHLPGARLEDCFEIGKRLALEITKLFPYPMEMKFEKVYESLVLVSKKRYYGKSYEAPNTEPKYEGKGLECVRRDGIEQTQNLMAKMINTLIDKKDLSEVKRIFIEEYQNVKKGVTLQNYLALAKEVKFLKYSQKSMPAHGHAAKRFQQIDPMMLPKYGQRIKYVILEGYKQALKERSIPIFQYLLSQSPKTLDYEHYVTKLMLPPLHRVFVSLTSLEKFLFKNLYRQQNANLKKSSIEQNILMVKQNQLYEKQKVSQMADKCKQLCNNCIGMDGVDEKQCIQLNCRVLYVKRRVRRLQKEVDRRIQRQNQPVEKGKRRIFELGKRTN